jgi:UDP-N-acetyl-alpha-D-muramoyl-L-alanyl-L-glutamate epimerase
MHTLDSLRQKHPRISFDSYSYQEESGHLTIDFHYTLHPAIPLTTSYVFPKAKVLDNLDPFIANLGIIELISYWKAACPPEIDIHPYHLNPEQIAWWHHLLIHGMGEFFYTNNIDFTSPDFVTFTSKGPTLPPLNGSSIPKSISWYWRR